jgi:hypothetical protein
MNLIQMNIFTMTTSKGDNLRITYSRCCMKSLWCVLLKELNIGFSPYWLVEIESPEVLQVWSSLSPNDYHKISYLARGMVGSRQRNRGILLVSYFWEFCAWTLLRWAGIGILDLDFQGIIKSHFLSLSPSKYIYSIEKIN